MRVVAFLGYGWYNYPIKITSVKNGVLNAVRKGECKMETNMIMNYLAVETADAED